MFIFFIVLGILFVCAAGAANAMQDTLDFHYYSSVFTRWKNRRFWGPRAETSDNKYKNGDSRQGPAFCWLWGLLCSTGSLVFLTDGWHLTKFFTLNGVFFGFALVIYGSLDFLNVWVLLGEAILLRALFGLFFVWFYNRVLVKKSPDNPA